MSGASGPVVVVATLPSPPPPLATALPVPPIGYARLTWEDIRARARKAAARNVTAACYFVFFGAAVTLVPLTCAGFGVIPAFLVVGVVVLGMGAVGYLVALGAYRGTVERECRRSGLCVRCGYDLRASESRCPECGRRILRRVTLPPASASRTAGSASSAPPG